MDHCLHCSAPIVAWYTIRPSFNTVGLCRRHLGMWLNNAEDDPELAPVELVYVGDVGPG